MGPKTGVKFVRFNHELVIIVIVMTKFDCIWLFLKKISGAVRDLSAAGHGPGNMGWQI